MKTEIQALVSRLEALIDADQEIVWNDLEGEASEDIAEALLRLDVEYGLHILSKLTEAVAAEVLVELPTETARNYLSELPDATVARYLDILPMDDALDLRETIGEARFESLLGSIPKQDAEEIRRLLSYPEDSAGQIMTESFFWVSPEATMRSILDDMRRAPEEKYETINTIYVLGPDRHLLGILSLRRVLRSKTTVTARETMKEDFTAVHANDDQEIVARTMAHYNLAAVPVIDERGRMLGIVTADDAQEVIEAADTEDVLKLGGVGGDGEAYLSLGVWQLVKRRVPWLLGLFVAESLTGNVLRYYGQGGGGDEVKLNPLAFFIPLLIGAGGNSGSQVTTTITRALALGDVHLGDWHRVVRRELSTSVISGTILGIVGFFRAHINIPVLGWGTPLDLSLVVGISLPAIVIWSTSVGSMLPILAKRVGIDPAVMSAPFISTFVDATGLVIYFEIAKHLLGHLGAS